jgi:hypothetical protein
LIHPSFYLDVGLHLSSEKNDVFGRKFIQAGFGLLDQKEECTTST